MTIKEVAHSLYGLSVAGFFNGEKFTVTRLEKQIRAWMQGGQKRIVMQIALPDGWWYFNVIRFADRPDAYSYYIPETRDDEIGVKKLIGLN